MEAPTNTTNAQIEATSATKTFWWPAQLRPFKLPPAPGRYRKVSPSTAIEAIANTTNAQGIYRRQVIEATSSATNTQGSYVKQVVEATTSTTNPPVKPVVSSLNLAPVSSTSRGYS